MNIDVYKVKQFSSTYKNIIVVDGKPICIVKGDKTTSDVIAYIQGYSQELKDGKIMKIIDKELNKRGKINEY